MIRGSRRVATSRPALRSRAANPAGRHFDKPAPRPRPKPQAGLRGSNQTGAHRVRKPGPFPRLCWPRFSLPDLTDAGGPGLSLGFRRQRRQSWTGRPSVTGQPCAPSHPQCDRVSSFQDPSGFLKGISSDHLGFAETRKGAPTNWAGTPGAPHLALQTTFAKGFFAK